MLITDKQAVNLLRDIADKLERGEYMPERCSLDCGMVQVAPVNGARRWSRTGAYSLQLNYRDMGICYDVRGTVNPNADIIEKARRTGLDVRRLGITSASE